MGNQVLCLDIEEKANFHHLDSIQAKLVMVDCERMISDLGLLRIHIFCVSSLVIQILTRKPLLIVFISGSRILWRMNNSIISLEIIDVHGIPIEM